MFTEKANAIFNRAIADYHLYDDVDHHFENPYEAGSLEALLYDKNMVDTVQWHLEDIIRYASMLAGDGRNEEGVVFSYRSIHLATTERTRGLNEARGYGFRITKRSDPFLGHLWPSDGYGLADPASGSLIAVSPDDGFFVALLLNGHGTSDDRREIARMHKLLLNAAYAAFQHDEE